MFTIISPETHRPLAHIPFIPTERAQKDQDEWLWIEEDVFLEDQAFEAERDGFLWSYRPQHKLFSSTEKMGSCTRLWNHWYPNDINQL